MGGQKKSDFSILIPDITIEGSKYNDLVYIESRPEPQDMGIVYVDMWNGMQRVTLDNPLDEQLRRLVNLVTSGNESKAIAVQMRALYFDLGVNKLRGKGISRLRMSLYKVDNDKYYFLNTIDTLLVDEQKKIRPETSNVITSFIIENLPSDVSDEEEALDMQQVVDIDMYEKNSIPFYMESNLPDGIYYKYQSLKNLTPDEISPVNITKQDDDKIKEAKVADPENSGKEKKLKPEEVYAFILGGEPYIGFEGDFYKASYNEGFWSFKITRKVAGSGFSLGIGVGGGNRSVGGGGVGIGIPIGGKKETIDIFIDHLNGGLLLEDLCIVMIQACLR